MKIFGDYLEDQAGIAARVKEIIQQPQPADDYSKMLIRLPGVLDMTTLEGSDNREKVISLCRQARFSAQDPGFPDAAAVCVYPSLVRIVAEELRGSGIRVASVAGAFPSGQSSLKVKLEEIRFAVGEGAEEIDAVISRGKLLEGNESEVFDELCAIRETCGDVTLKTILETGELPTVEMIRKASELAIRAGSDFVKTSTGKIPVGATPEAFLVMLDTVREYLEKTGKAVGVKAAGGVRTPEQAMIYARLLESILGEEFLAPRFFRIGASSLASELLHAIRS
jgi:deoxyribose-phosphate aldolase